MTSPTPDLAELRRLAEAATPGPWHAATGAALQTDAGDDATHVWYCRWRDERFLSISKVLDNELDQTTPEDAAFIAAANPAAVLALLDKLDALAARLAAAEVEARAQTERAVHAEKQADHETRVAVHLAGIVSGLRAKIERVRALHAVADCGDSTCEHCPCSTCPPRLGWPCPTIRALNEEPQP